MAVKSRWFISDHQHKSFVIVIKQQTLMHKTLIFTFVNGDVQ